MAVKKKASTKKVATKKKVADKVNIKAKVVKISGMGAVGSMAGVGYNNVCSQLSNVNSKIEMMQRQLSDMPLSARAAMRNDIKKMRDYRSHLMQQKSKYKRFL